MAIIEQTKLVVNGLCLGAVLESGSIQVDEHRNVFFSIRLRITPPDKQLFLGLSKDSYICNVDLDFDFKPRLVQAIKTRIERGAQ